ncbi:MAG: ATP-binding cassette domain-containing protein [Spirochaetales bacterium]|nr:ATP-binding cassette domain-containing protein [Spirochaetales bacterium]
MILKAENLSFSFGKNEVLHNLSFSARKGEVISFVGPSGCGKTTILNLIAGVYKCQEESLFVDTNNISYVFQHDSLLSWNNSVNNVLLSLKLKNINYGPEKAKEAREILRKVGLQGYEEYFPAKLSGGMKKRVEIARALITQPDILLLDEPFTFLDIITREKLNLLIKKIKSTLDTTIVLVTHSVEEACFLSNKVYVLSSHPACIMDTKEIESHDEKPRTSVVLNDIELRADREIRKHVKTLWDIDTVKLVDDTENKSDKKSVIWKFLIPVQLLVFLGLLTFLKKILSIEDYLFPYPLDIFKRFFETIMDGSIFLHLGITVYESLSGFFLAFLTTFVLGYCIAKSKLISRLFMPFLIAFNTIPSVALAPFLLLWFGFGAMTKISVSFIVVFFPMLINNISAIEMANKQLSFIIKFYKPRPITQLFLIEFPASLPVIFSGIKVSITLSVIGAVVGEFVAGAKGLGALVMLAKANFDSVLMFVSLVWLILLGLSYYTLARIIYSIILKKLHQ